MEQLRPGARLGIKSSGWNTNRLVGLRRRHPRQRLQPCSVTTRVELPQENSVSEPKVSHRFRAGPDSDAPDFSEVDKQPLNAIIMNLFRRKMVQAIDEDVEEQGYQGIIRLTRRLNSKFLNPRQTQARTVSILNSLFPPWLPPAFKVLFAKPFPELSCKMNALATALTCQWLMGECKVNDVEIDGGKIGQGHGVLVRRCRYLEESGCASVCINSCKVPTQEFFEKDMGLPLLMTPNYEDFSCQFSFGRTPPSQADDAAFQTPCFSQCPSKRSISSSSCPGIKPM